jgi:hypothetical protein
VLVSVLDEVSVRHGVVNDIVLDLSAMRTMHSHAAIERVVHSTPLELGL